MFKLKNHTLGFTLIELLVVIAVFSLLIVIVIVALSNARGKSRDAKRMADLGQIAIALEMYNNDKGAYPCESNSRANNNEWSDCYTDALRPYMSNVPRDPVNSADYYYSSNRLASGSDNCKDHYALCGYFETGNENYGKYTCDLADNAYCFVISD